MGSMSAWRIVFFLLLAAAAAPAVERPGTVFKVFQFPPDRMPRIDGKADDWDIVPQHYAIGTDQLVDTVLGRKLDPKDLDVRVKVGWVRGLNRLYFLYEAYDNFWDFASGDLHNDIFEVVVDADMSGGPLIEAMHPNRRNMTARQAYESFQGVHAQNYHVLTPPGPKDWAMVWGCQQPWLRELPYSNAAFHYDFKPGESGKLVLEFWITPFDHASCEGPSKSIESVLAENNQIGLSWSILDYDDAAGSQRGFWNLSHKTTMYGNASDLVAFRLMPLEPELRKPVEVQWSFRILDPDRFLVAFSDLSSGDVRSWKWDFGDGQTSTERHPIHTYPKTGNYSVALEAAGPSGSARRVKVWDVVLK
jgi:hypothetical protein